MKHYDLIVIGGGPAGMSAALGAWEAGCGSVLLLEQEERLGGVLPQCIHTGFGLFEYGEELTGPEYAARQAARLARSGVEVVTGAAVLSVEEDRRVTAMGADCGLLTCTARAVVLACGAREQPAGALPITGTRPAGVFTAGQAQQLLNLGGYDIGERIIILGSGDIGMIVARRFALEGKTVVGVAEQAPRGGGLVRNRVQCLEEFHIPLWLSCTVTQLHGRERLEGVTLRYGDGREERIDCDTLVTSVGLLPRRELLDGREELPEGVFLCGNADRIYDLVDRAAEDACRLGGEIARWLRGGPAPMTPAREAPSDPGRELPPGHLICLCCPVGCELAPDRAGGVLGAACGKGEGFYRLEQEERRRWLTFAVTVQGVRLPLRTTVPIPTEKFGAVLAAARAHLFTLPVRAGEILLTDPGDWGAHVAAQRDCETPKR